MKPWGHVMRELDTDSLFLLSLLSPFPPMTSLLLRWHYDGMIPVMGDTYFHEQEHICLIGLLLIIVALVLGKKRVRAKIIVSFLGHVAFWGPIFYLSHLETKWERSVEVNFTTAWPYVTMAAVVLLFCFQTYLFVRLYRSSRTGGITQENW